MTFVDMQVKWSMTLTDRLGPEILTMLEIKGQVLHRVRLHVRENTCLISGLLRRILKFLRMIFLIARFCGW